MSKICFIDVDGTLLDYENNLPESAVKAIREARANGNKVYICTGRSEAEVYDYIWDIGLDGMIGGNGSYVKDGDKVILWDHLSAQETRRIINWLKSRDLEFYLEANSGLYASKNFKEKGLKPLKDYMGKKGEEIESISIEDIFHKENLYRDDINKISFILNSYQDYLDAKEAFPDLKVGTWGGVGETALFGDIGVKNIDKGKAIDKLLDYLGADLKDTIAFGDAKVDIPMLEKCNIGVAVGSGGEEIKEIADYVTDSVNNDGIYKAFEHFNLI